MQPEPNGLFQPNNTFRKPSRPVPDAVGVVCVRHRPAGYRPRRSRRRGLYFCMSVAPLVVCLLFHSRQQQSPACVGPGSEPRVLINFARSRRVLRPVGYSMCCGFRTRAPHRMRGRFVFWQVEGLCIGSYHSLCRSVRLAYPKGHARGTSPNPEQDVVAVFAYVKSFSCWSRSIVASDTL